MKVNLNRIKAERVARGLTQKELADVLGKPRSWLAKREPGIVPLGADELSSIASALGIEPNQMSIFFESNVPDCQQ